jgi:hypothetical protein
MIKKIFILACLLFTYSGIKASENNLFPEVPGWKMKLNDKVYNSGNLWELIDGAADIFLSYYFEDLHIAEYSRKDQIIRVELYKHKTFEDTYGIYTAERMPDYPQVDIGSQGYKSQGVLNFFAGNYYIKIMSAGAVEVDDQTISMFAEKVDGKLALSKQMPEVLSLFPSEGRVFLSDTYIAQNFLGYSFMNHAFSVKYEKPGDLQLFVIKLLPEQIQGMLDQYLKLMKEDKVKQIDNLYVVTDLFNGIVYLGKKDQYLVGVMNCNDEGMAKSMINQVLQKINSL